MAKRRRTKSRTSTKIVRVSAKPIVIRHSAPIARVRHRRSSSSSIGAKTLLSNERAGALFGAAALAYLDKHGTSLPTVPVLGRAGTAGIALWYASKHFHSAQLNHAATGVLSIAIYELIKEGKISGVDGIDTV